MDHWDCYDAPELAIHRVRDGAGKPFLMLTGPEPDHEWERFTSAVATVSTRLGAELVLGFHGIPMGVPHTRPLGVTAHGTTPELAGGSRPIVDRLQVAGSAASLLELRLGEGDPGPGGVAVRRPPHPAHAPH